MPNSNAYWEWLRNEKGVDPKKLFKKNTPYLTTGIPAELHQLTWCADTAISFINEPREGPWMLSVNPFDPHPPFDPPPEFHKKYNPKDMPHLFLKKAIYVDKKCLQMFVVKKLSQLTQF